MTAERPGERIVDPMVRFLDFLQGLPPEALWPAMLLVCFASLVILYRVFGVVGAQVYAVVAVLGANLQVLKAVQFSFFPEPVALGTVMFASSYLATDLLAERHGPRTARTAVFLGFAGYFVFVATMLLTLGFAPLTAETAGESMAWAVENQAHLEALFLPAPGLFAAGMIAYLTSQLHDVWLFDRLKRQFGGRHLWLRNNLSTMVSALVDNTIFSVLAWIVFAPDPLPWSTVLFTYILGTYVLRLVIALLDTPFLYLARRLAPNDPSTPSES